MKTSDFINVRYTHLPTEESPLMGEYFNIRRHLVDTKLNDLKDRGDNWKYMKHSQQMAYMKEICKLNINFGRQTGHSYFQHWFLNDCTKKGKVCLHISYKYAMMMYFIEAHNPIKSKSKVHKPHIDNHFVISFGDCNDSPNIYNEMEGVSRPIDYVIIDTSDLYKSHQIDKILSTIQSINLPTLILYM
jgi:hypothetical protein